METEKKLRWRLAKRREICRKRSSSRTWARHLLRRGASVHRFGVVGLGVDEVAAVLEEPCRWCGRGWVNGMCHGLDRVDNDKGYSLDNVASSCSLCNLSRGTMEAERFVYLCRLVAAEHPPNTAHCEVCKRLESGAWLPSMYPAGVRPVVHTPPLAIEHPEFYHRCNKS